VEELQKSAKEEAAINFELKSRISHLRNDLSYLRKILIKSGVVESN
jgi:hypothetical protein